jgi:hypothetical protein
MGHFPIAFEIGIPCALAMHSLCHWGRIGCAVFIALHAVAVSAATDAAREMSEVAQAFGTTLDDALRARAFLDLDPELLKHWHFVPTEMVGFGRKGPTLGELNPPQRERALELLRISLSARGYEKTTNIMTLEAVLRDTEQNGRFERNPEKYYVAVFGTPSADGTWAWRFEGHHVSLLFVVVEGKEFAVTPSFLGTNPAEVRSGPYQGRRVLGAEEDLARRLVQTLDSDQRDIALIDTQAPADILTVARNDLKPLEPAGLGYSRMSAEQQQLLRTLVREYVGRVRPDIADEQMALIERAGWDQVSFAWAGGLEKGQPHYYRVQSTGFLLEYDNTQNDANHVHAVWRNFRNDHGGDLLKQHYEHAHAHGPE